VKFTLKMAAATHPGLVRSQNEDALAADPQRGFAVLADGMGGCNAGEVASRIAVDRVSSSLKAGVDRKQSVEVDDAGAERLLARHIASANAAVYEAAHLNAEYSGMGTTLVAALWYADRMAAGHVGDSRLYRLRQGALSQLTHDHSGAQEQIDDGVLSPTQARYSNQRSVVTRAVGIEASVNPDVRSVDVAPGDLYILCSDGLTDMLTDEEIQQALTGLPSELQSAADVLVQLANAAGGRDNVSVILARVEPAFVEARR
jgi:serine/threonine protein phosphatase PrpC